jgi:hypothetical protein
MAAALLDKFGGMTLDMLFLTGVGPAYPLITACDERPTLSPTTTG